MRPVTKVTFFGIRLAIFVLAGYWTLIFIGTHLPTLRDFSPNVNDKVKHFAAFFGLACLLCYCTCSGSSYRRFGWILLVCMIYGALDELTQGLVRGRTPDFYDFYADTFGASVAVGMYMLAKWVGRWDVFTTPAGATDV